MRIKLKSPEVVNENFDDETIIVHLGTGKYYSVRFSGFWLWRFLEAGYSKEEATKKLADGYSVDETTLKSDVDHFMQELMEHDLIVIMENGTAEKDSVPWTDNPGSYTKPILESYDDMQDLLLIDPIHDIDEEKGWPHKPEDQE